MEGEAGKPSTWHVGTRWKPFLSIRRVPLYRGSVRSASGLIKYWMKMYSKITITTSTPTAAEATEQKKNLCERSGSLL